MKLTEDQKRMTEENHNMIYGFLRRYNLKEEDWYDIAAIGLIRAVCSYIPGDAKFSTYANVCMLNEVRKELVYKKRHYNNELSLNHEYENDDGEVYEMIDFVESKDDVEKTVLDVIYLQELKEFLLENLSTEKQKKVIELIFEGKDKMTCLKEAGISSQGFLVAIDKIYPKYHKRFCYETSNTNKRRNRVLKEHEEKLQKEADICSRAKAEYEKKKETRKKKLERSKKPYTKGFNINDKIKLPDNNRLYTIRARDERFLICTRPIVYGKETEYFIIDLKEKWYGPDNLIFSPEYKTELDCLSRLKDLQENKMSVSKKKGSQLDFYVA